MPWNEVIGFPLTKFWETHFAFRLQLCRVFFKSSIFIFLNFFWEYLKEKVLHFHFNSRYPRRMGKHQKSVAYMATGQLLGGSTFYQHPVAMYE
jgi:hypothetical protein